MIMLLGKNMMIFSSSDSSLLVKVEEVTLHHFVVANWQKSTFVVIYFTHKLSRNFLLLTSPLILHFLSHKSATTCQISSIKVSNSKM